MWQEKSWQQKIVEKLPGKVQVQQTRQDGVTQGIVFGILAASAVLQVYALTHMRSPGWRVCPSLDITKPVECEFLSPSSADSQLQEFFLPSSPGSNNVPGLQLGLAFVASVYFLRDGKKLTLGACHPTRPS